MEQEKVVQIVSRGRSVWVTRAEIDELPRNAWSAYCAYRLSMSHRQAIAELTHFTVTYPASAWPNGVVPNVA